MQPSSSSISCLNSSCPFLSVFLSPNPTRTGPYGPTNTPHLLLCKAFRPSRTLCPNSNKFYLDLSPRTCCLALKPQPTARSPQPGGLDWALLPSQISETAFWKGKCTINTIHVREQQPSQ